MIKIYGPHSPRRVDRRAEIGNYEPFDELGFQAKLTILRDALTLYEKEFSVSIIPYDGSIEEVELGDPPKYFFYISSGQHQLVDIHIERTGKEICIKQDFNVKLENGDIVLIGELIC